MGTYPNFDLVAQGPVMSPALAEQLSHLLGHRPPERITDRAFRFRGVRRDERVAAWCEARHIDHAFMPPGRRFADLRLLAMDMDSTLITIECIDELGALAGRKDEIAAITERAMRGELDYPQSLRRRVALLEGLEEAALGQVYAGRLALTPGAEALVAACKAHGVRILLVSGGFSYFTERLKARLGIDDTLSNTLEIRNGRLTGRLVGDIVDARAKARRFRDVMKAAGARRDETLAIGDGANDLEMMAEAGISVAFRAKPLVRARATCALNWSGLDAVANLFE